MTDPIKRLHYFDGQFLREPDFTDEQTYHLGLERDHARLLHTPGIAQGLDVPMPPAGSTAVTVHAGVAYDDQGRRIVLADDSVVELAGIPDGGTAFITIAYAEAQTDPTTETGTSGNRRWTEAPVLLASTSSPIDPNLTLLVATVGRTGNVVTSVSNANRLTAGSRGGDLTVSSLTLSAANVATTGWVRTSLASSGVATLGGSLLVSGSVTANQLSGSLAPNMVATAAMADGAVTNPKLANASVDANKLAPNSVDSTKIVDGGVGTNEIANGAVSLVKLAANSVDASKIVDGSVGTSELANGAVTAAKLQQDNLVIPGRVGIGLPDNPGYRFDVYGRMRVRRNLAVPNETSGIWLGGYYNGEIDASFMGMQDTTTVGFWSNIPNFAGWRLSVGLLTGDLSVTGNAFKPGGGSWGTSSDERLKHEIRPLPQALERLGRLRPVSFEWREPEKQGNLKGPQMGFLAHEVEEVFPSWVGVDGKGYKVLTIRGFEALCVQAIKELTDENRHLKALLAGLEQRVAALEQAGGGAATATAAPAPARRRKS
ncbi:MAG TPA: tail fiber domain-containing protein [Burkholderiaceae bacterium]